MEGLLPGLTFFTLLTAGASGMLALSLSALVAAGFLVARLTARGAAVPALVGLIGVAVSLIVALYSGHVVDSFLPHLVVDALAAAILFGSALVRWPAFGIAFEFLMQTTAWRKEGRLYGQLRSLTLLWAALFAIRGAIELPFYVTRDLPALTIATLILGLPLFSPLAVHTWRNLRSMLCGEFLANPGESTSQAGEN